MDGGGGRGKERGDGKSDETYMDKDIQCWGSKVIYKLYAHKMIGCRKHVHMWYINTHAHMKISYMKLHTRHYRKEIPPPNKNT